VGGLAVVGRSLAAPLVRPQVSRDVVRPACPKCGSEMKVVVFIERCQRDVVEKILRYCGLWEGSLRTLATARGRPSTEGSDQDASEPRELQLVLDPELL
jgi:hypothetical protein